MAAQAAQLGADARAKLLKTVQKLEGVLHAAFEAGTGDLWVVRDAAYEQGPIEVAIRNRVAGLGHDPSKLVVRVALPSVSGPRRRVRFVSVERQEERTGRVSVTVRLEWNGELHEGSAAGEKGPAIELKTTARAAVEALERLTEEELELRIIGVKPIHAFDSELMVASLLRTGGGHQRLVGAVVVAEDQLSAAAMAVLSALNRTLGNFLHTPD